MKSTFVFLLAVVSVSPTFSSGYYPLQIGNRWDYGELAGPGQWHYLYTRRIIGDTLMPNGRTYAIERSTLNNPWNIRYLRQADSIVYSFTDQGEVVAYDFSVADGDTISVVYQTGDTVTTVVHISQTLVFGGLRRTWTYETWSSQTSYHLMEDIADSVGYSHSIVEPGYSEYCMGAIINGHQYGTIVSVDPDDRSVPASYRLGQNFPNPFNPTTTISYWLPAKSHVTVDLFTIAGQRVARIVSTQESEGVKSIVFNGSTLASGVYVYRIEAIPESGNGYVRFIASRKMILMK